MLNADRQQQILDILKKERSVSVAKLARELFASEPTIRRDLSSLESRGYLKRVYGGAVIGGSPDREIPYDVRASEHGEAKSAIAQKAKEFVKKGDVVFLDGSSSAYHMADVLKDIEDILVITSGARTALALAENGVRVISTGGKMITKSYTYVGGHAEACIRGINADVVFFSCRGLSHDGEMTDLSIDEINLRKIMLERAKKKVLLCDSSKIGKQYVYSLGSVDNIDVIITENGIKTSE